MQCQVRDFHQKQHKQTDWVHYADAEATINDMLHPEYWIPVTKEPVRTGDKIIVQREDMKLYAEFLVMTKASTGIRVELLMAKEFKTTEDLLKLPAEYTVEYRGRKTQWSVVRVSDSRVVKGGFATEQEATEYKKNYLQALA